MKTSHPPPSPSLYSTMKNSTLLRFTFLLLLLFSTLPTISSLPTTTPSEVQFYNIIKAISSYNDFRNWARILSAVDPSTFPLTATFFIPNDVSISQQTSQFDPSNIGYHIVPTKLTSNDLLLLPTGSRIPTLLPNNSILVTCNEGLNFTIDDANITHPDLYVSSSFSVHGISSVLNYTVFGHEVFLDSNSTTTQDPNPPTSIPIPFNSTSVSSTDGHLPKSGESQTFDYQRSDAAAASLYIGLFPVILVTVVFAVFG